MNRTIKTPKGKMISVPDAFTPEQELQAALQEDMQAPETPSTPPAEPHTPHTGFLGGISNVLESAAKKIRNVPFTTAGFAPFQSGVYAPITQGPVGRFVFEQAKEIPAGLLDMAAHPIKNAPMLGATLATLRLGPSAGIARAMLRSAAGNIAGQGVKSIAKAATGGGEPSWEDVPKNLLELGRDVSTEGFARLFPMLRRAAVRDEMRALAQYIDPKELLTRQTAGGNLIPTFSGPGGNRTVTPALEDLAAQSLATIPGIRAMGRKETASGLDALMETLRKQKTSALEAVASHEIPESRGKQKLQALMEETAQRGKAPRAQMNIIRKTANEFFDRPSLERNAGGELKLGRDGLPIPVTIDRAKNSAVFSPQQIDSMVQQLGTDIAEAGAFGKNVPAVKIQAYKAIRSDLRDALLELAPEIEQLNLTMSRTKPLAGAFGAATWPGGPKVGMGELGAFSGNRLSAGVAASRRPNILSALARIENAASKLPGNLQPSGLTALMRTLQQAYVPTEASHSR